MRGRHRTKQKRTKYTQEHAQGAERTKKKGIIMNVMLRSTWLVLSSLSPPAPEPYPVGNYLRRCSWGPRFSSLFLTSLPFPDSRVFAIPSLRRITVLWPFRPMRMFGQVRAIVDFHRCTSVRQVQNIRFSKAWCWIYEWNYSKLWYSIRISAFECTHSPSIEHSGSVRNVRKIALLLRMYYFFYFPVFFNF